MTQAWLHGLGSAALSAAAALALGALPALLAAVWIAELAPPSLRAPLRRWLDFCASLPAVVWGSFAAWMVAAPLRGLVSEATADAVSCSVALAFMVVPTTALRALDALRSAPEELREAATALSASPWQVTWSAVVPSTRRALASAALLGLSRALGEVAALGLVTRHLRAGARGLGAIVAETRGQGLLQAYLLLATLAALGYAHTSRGEPA